MFLASRVSPTAVGVSHDSSRPVAVLHLALLLGTLFSSCLLSGCGLDQGFQELGSELVSPDVGYIEAPGRRIASGRFRRFSVRAPTLEDRYIAAFRSSKLVLIRFEEDGEQCEVGSAKSFGTSISGESAYGLGKREPLLPYLTTRDDSGRGDLRFTSYSCESTSLLVPDVPLPRESLSAEGHYHLIVANGSDDLLAIDPWGSEAVTLGHDVSYFDVKGEQLWSIEGGQLVLRDASLKELGRVGEAVSDVALARGNSSDWAAYIDDGVLFFVEADAMDTPSVLADDVCRLWQVGSSSERVLRFLSPCEDRHLVLYDVLEDERIDYVDDVVASSVVVRTAKGFDLNYWTGEESNRGTLWISLAGEEPVKVFDDALVQSGSLFRSWAVGVTDWNGESGNYVSWRDGQFKTIAEKVAEVNALGVVANFENGSGDLLQILGDDSTRKIGSKVPLDATRGRAFLGNASGERGDLFVIEGEPPARKVASGVGVGSFLFSVQIDTLLMMLSNFDAATQTATLQVRLLDTGDQFEVSSQVSELVEVGFPRPGVLYNVATGSREGLWFAGVR